MKKLFLALFIAIATFQSASAQFEKGKIYGGASLSGFGMGYSRNAGFNMGLNVDGGYMFKKDWAVIGDFGFNVAGGDVSDVSVGGKVRWYMEQNGLFFGGGLKYKYWNLNNGHDFVLAPEVGWCYFINKHVMLEPSFYTDLSFADFVHKTSFGIKAGISFFF